ncbi:MAG: hypothetical protein AAF709_23575, partial [Pseudomonadota bacterium]
MSNTMKAGNPVSDAFEALGRKFRVIDMKYNNAEGETKRTDLVVVSNDEKLEEPIIEDNGET